MAQKKFSFVPIRVEKGREKEDQGFCPYVRISKAGVINFSNHTLTYLGIGNSTASLRIFADVSRRAFAFQITKTVGKKKDGYRILSPRKASAGAYMALLSIRSFLRKLDNVPLPSPKLEINFYKDQDKYLGIGDVYYIEIPSSKKVEPYPPRDPEDLGF